MKTLGSLFLCTAVICILIISGCAPRSGDVIAITNIQLVPMTADVIIEDQTVLIQGSRIVDIGPADEIRIPKQADRIDGDGGYLMPGLADMHVHVREDWPVSQMSLYLANGVTTIRSFDALETEDGSYLILNWRDEITSGDRPGPTIYTSGPILFGPVPDADQVVRDQVTQGFDFIKLYSYLSQDEFHLAMETASQMKIYTAGHIPYAVGLEGIIQEGMDEIAHIEELDFELLDMDRNQDLSHGDWLPYIITSFEKQFDISDEFELSQFIDQQKEPISEIAEKISAAGIPVCTTLVVDDVIVEKLFSPQSFLARPENIYLPPSYITKFNQGEEKHQVILAGHENLALYKYELDHLFLEILREAGVLLLLSTDAGTGAMGIVPGYSVHDELQILTDHGFSPYEAIATGTINAAQVIEKMTGEGDFGTIEIGKRADLILLSDNPLEDVTNIRSPLGVMAAGRWYAKDRLTQMIDLELTTSIPPSSQTATDLTYTATPIITPWSTQSLDIHPTPTPTPIQYDYPRYEPATCQFVNAYMYDVDCGYLVVPEDRDHPDGPEVRMHVAVFHSTSANPQPDPVIYLAGGGGVNQLDASGYYLRNGGYQILEDRDYIFYNQRGSHYNQPELDCPGYNSLLTDLASQGIDSGDFHARKLEFLLNCRDDLVARGNNLSMYNSAVNAADLNDLRVVLGYDQINLYGTSYGTRLALTFMREYPQTVRSVILDSVFPPPVNYFSEYGVNAFRAFEELFDSCSTAPFCQEAYPDLEAVFYQVINNLDLTPASMVWMEDTIQFNGGNFSEAIYLMLYTAEIGSAPKAIYQADKGDFSPLEPYILGVFDITTGSINWGAYYSIHCAEEALLDSFENALTLSVHLPSPIKDYYLNTSPNSAKFNFSLCESWGVNPAASIESKPVVSDIPSLIFAGQFDPITPPAWAKLAAANLDNSYLFEFPGLGHGVMRANTCAQEIGVNFINNPVQEPDNTCIKEFPGPDFH